VIGATVAAFATSSPELAVAISSARDDRSAVAVGDALGSNIVNIALVLGIAAIVAPLVIERAELRRNLPFALAAPLLTGALAWDGELSRIDGTLLLVVFLVWLTRTALHARRARAAIEVLEEARTGRALAAAAAGLVLLIGAGQSIVWAAKGIGETLGLDEFVVGATLVAIGTSAPELPSRSSPALPSPCCWPAGGDSSGNHSVRRFVASYAGYVVVLLATSG
jgi:cation:H+ antiporter